MLIFPEGTRGKEEGKLLEGKPGATMLANRADCLIVPVGIAGKYKLRGRVEIKVGTPVKVSQYIEKRASSNELQRVTNEVVMERIAELVGVNKNGN